MIGKGKSIAHTAASMKYGWNQEKDATVVLKQHLVGDNPKEISNEFKIIQQMNTKCEKNTISFVLSPTIEDGKKLTDKRLGEIAKEFIKEMKLTDHQAIAFVHKDKEHIHIHLYVNRIDFKGKAYADNFIGKRASFHAEKIARAMGLKTVKEVQNEKLHRLKHIRAEMKQLHDTVLRLEKPRSFEQYITKMKVKDVKVIPSINKANKLQGFRFEYKGVNLKGSEVHRSMSGGKIGAELANNTPQYMSKASVNTVNILGKGLEMSVSLVASIAKSAVKKVISKGIDIGL
ncbi:relaxase/mobilization nuclease domain-containing protein [Cellulophaga baltica]|uniref:Relaxase/Mobilisation nuclease domain-containing protein n=1 Tax=Cellulophaga baltica TaxID=76594 RepID=A0A1G7D635_9FLAO|nr:relaxase/mobilization nuclease domain-containing protein [Cellulophaga baltica]SDE46991.1 Relaxase/Mobilisation nuclease domain-containing protein [Cellulophaga baltica]